MSTDLKVDLLFNYASLGVLAAAGLVMNLLVVKLMGEAALGVFNQAYAIYIASSQLAVGGVHNSVLRSVAQAPGADSRGPIIASGAALALALGLAAGGLVVATRELWAALLGSPEIAQALLFVGPALALFSVNKVLLAALNGLQRMRLFAVLQATRFLVLIAVLTGVAVGERSAAQLSAAFPLAELAVMALAIPGVLARVTLSMRHVQRPWLWHHSSFGARGLLSGVFIELNTRVDVLAIGFFLADEDVGRYSLAAVFAEGLYQCLVVVRNQMNPVLARLLHVNDSQQLVQLVHRAWRYLYPGMALTYLGALGAFYLVLQLQPEIAEPGEALLCYAILGLGVWVVAGFVPFDGVLLHSGRPGHYTLVTFSIALTNAVLNLLLIPSFGIQGAALGTALAFGMSILYLSLVMRWQLGFTYLSAGTSRR